MGNSREIHIIPKIGQMASADVGDNIIRSQTFDHVRELYCENEVIYNRNGKLKSMKITPNFAFVSKEKEFDKYCSLYNCIYVQPNSSEIIRVELTSVVFLNSNTYPIISEKPVFLKARELSRVPVKEEFHQEFIYNGKVGELVKFSYREFYDNLARQAFTQDVQYDLSQGNIVGFKGAKFEIIEASNYNLNYKIINPFKTL